ncbi:hemerythrin domain-containing protein [Azohydromonas sp. G-1-1-14]|uniref:Hemerythrin domain-containing protein n=2 Tax=Azohydromonas caseinilytica TaxID=2728836 RepID=A0A848FHN2_9BURK|nr:hemerythrin domain-containing protein [Azohydromonas caseinilytica]
MTTAASLCRPLAGIRSTCPGTPQSACPGATAAPREKPETPPQAGDQQKEQTAQRICKLLLMHAQLEEELLYPAARQALGRNDLIEEAKVEHASARDLIKQIQGMDPSEELYDAKVKVLGEYTKHHVQEEENELIPQLQQKGGLDLSALGRQMMTRRQELMQQMGVQEQQSA